MNEDLLNKLLRRGMQTGDVPMKLDDALVDHWLTFETAEVPDTIQASIKSKLKQRLQVASQTIAPVGQLILAVREAAGLSRAQVSRKLGKPEEYLRHVEENSADFPNATAEEFASLMEILHLKFSKVSEAIYRNIRVLGFGSSLGWHDAVSMGLTNDDKYSETGATTPWQKRQQIRMLAERRKAAEAWLTNLLSVLRTKNRTDLLH